jgi:hypothetical protein
MNATENTPHAAAFEQLRAALAERARPTRPAAVVPNDPRSRRLVLTLVRA